MRQVLVCFLFIVLANNVTSQDSITDYYKEITSKSEYTLDKDTSSYVPKRWKKDVKIFVKGFPDSVVCSELDKVVSELNELIETIEIKITDNESEANLIAYFGWFIDYDKIEPKVVSFTANNYGLFCVYSDRSSNLVNGSFYVDIVRCNWFPTNEAIVFKKHLLREELTQSLGLFNDSMKYPNSIFYQVWSETTEFSELDKELIRRHYRN